MQNGIIIFIVIYLLLFVILLPFFAWVCVSVCSSCCWVLILHKNHRVVFTWLSMSVRNFVSFSRKSLRFKLYENNYFFCVTSHAGVTGNGGLGLLLKLLQIFLEVSLIVVSLIPADTSAASLGYCLHWTSQENLC